MKLLVSSKIRMVLVGFIVACCLPVVGAATEKTEDNDTDSTGITAAGPRLGPVAVVEVIFPNRHALDELIRQGYDISGVRGNVATIYAIPEELDRLNEAGYDCRIIEWQPNPPGPGATGLGNYHSYSSLTVDLEAYAAAHTNICRLYTLGRSVQGRELWALLITDNPDDEEDEPEFKYVSTMHGNEPVGTEMCLYFIDLLLTEYGTNPRITALVDSTAIWIVPLMNPDGLELGSRYNANGYDLNRDFPTLTDRDKNVFDGGPMFDADRQPETRHIMNWTAENSFVLSAGFHTGALVVCYPYGYNEQMQSVDTPTPDDLLFEDISRRYSMHNTPMWNSSTFPDGIVNGAAWYVVVGAMDDWNYRYVSCNETTIELSNNFKPPESEIPAFWADNEESMLSYLQAVRIGVRGIITDSITGEPLYAEVWVEDINHPVFTDPDVGDYHRMLLLGIYNLTFNAPGYVPRLVKNVSVSLGAATRIDVELVAEDALADFDENGIVDFNDFAILAQYWSQDESSVDIAPGPFGDDIVDFKDIAVFAEYWLTAWSIPPLPAPASNPHPYDLARDVDINADLSWTAGVDAISHDVYFGTSSPPPFVCNQAATTFDPGTMAEGTGHYWRIDEVNAYGTTTGTVWRFTSGWGGPPP
jgi:carboxypeptidase D